MSLVSVRPHFRNAMILLGYEEHTDAIDFENIPSTILDDAFMMDTQPISSGSANQRAHEFDYGLVLRVFKRGFSDPVALYDEADEDIETILTSLLAPINRLSAEIKDIIPESINKIPLSASDDNDLIIEFNFTVKIIMCF